MPKAQIDEFIQQEVGKEGQWRVWEANIWGHLYEDERYIMVHELLIVLEKVEKKHAQRQNTGNACV